MVETTHDDAEGSFNHTTTFSYEVDFYGNWMAALTEALDLTIPSGRTLAVWDMDIAAFERRALTEAA